MAIEFTVEMRAGQTAAVVAESVVAVARELVLIDAETVAAQLLQGVVLGNGTWFRVSDSRSQAWQTVPAVLGFMPDVDLYFRLDKWTDISGQQDGLIRLALGLLEHVTGDMVLHREYETALFVRKDGVLTLNDRADLWTPERLAWVRLPHGQAFIDLDA
ncbi:hypothetical protein Caci_8656 [Catenulispora acidiphila DSM 44928]|uniref:Uncharacterized protein n=1 Tax=Catenulispora acidiphila (strain DSM 44928 / JCM 14897 / NBRC 102108 / NRRL B-24433 / ID139908) TaxID=479433 RepID=C7Q0D9_CATAD|nr:SitI3 family protein [Catenulispora acidiphila]ACU77472.1 hypothetical protein Caci_8656 [Catenulispora acidiphila DSM 44928]